MVPRRPHQRKRLLPRDRGIGRRHRRIDRALRVQVDAGEMRRVRVDVRAVLDAFQQRRAVGHGRQRFVALLRHPEFPVRMRGPQVRGAALDSSGLFRTHRRAVLNAGRVVENDHQRVRLRTEGSPEKS
jgi:hypothetical protein